MKNTRTTFIDRLDKAKNVALILF